MWLSPDTRAGSIISPPPICARTAAFFSRTFVSTEDATRWVYYLDYPLPGDDSLPWTSSSFARLDNPPLWTHLAPVGEDVHFMLSNPGSQESSYGVTLLLLVCDSSLFGSTWISYFSQ